jgi:hypothetical protein
VEPLTLLWLLFSAAVNYRVVATLPCSRRRRVLLDAGGFTANGRPRGPDLEAILIQQPLRLPREISGVVLKGDLNRGKEKATRNSSISCRPYAIAIRPDLGASAPATDCRHSTPCFPEDPARSIKHSAVQAPPDPLGHRLHPYPVKQLPSSATYVRSSSATCPPWPSWPHSLYLSPGWRLVRCSTAQ